MLFAFLPSASKHVDRTGIVCSYMFFAVNGMPLRSFEESRNRQDRERKARGDRGGKLLRHVILVVVSR